MWWAILGIAVWLIVAWLASWYLVDDTSPNANDGYVQAYTWPFFLWYYVLMYMFSWPRLLKKYRREQLRRIEKDMEKMSRNTDLPPTVRGRKYFQ